MTTISKKSIRLTLREKAQKSIEAFRAEEKLKTPDEIYEDWEIIAFKEILSDTLDNYILPFFPEEILVELNAQPDVLQYLYEKWSQEENPCALSFDDIYDWLLTEYAHILSLEEDPE